MSWESKKMTRILAIPECILENNKSCVIDAYRMALAILASFLEQGIFAWLAQKEGHLQKREEGC